MNEIKKTTQETKPINKKTYIIISIIFSIILGSTIIFKTYWNKTNWYLKQNEEKKEHITIFTHGSFGSIIGLIDLFKVLKDNVTGTIYKKTVSKMRKNVYFYSGQPIMQKGLIKIEPSFDLSSTSSARLAAYPILKAYEEVNKQFLKKEINNHFYTFGWSGLISQERRRKESIRFYNSLSEELELYTKSGIKPKIRILAHSHGGNVALNLSAVNLVINNFDNINSILKQTINEDEKEALILMYEQIKKLPIKENLTQTNGQKLFDYRPTNKNLKIDELLMFGTPIQPETECLVFNNFFNKIYNIYSSEDIIQDIDSISTKKNSSQRLKILEITPKKEIPKIIQLKIMIDRDMIKGINKNKIKTLTLAQTNTRQKTEANQSFLKRFFSRSRFSPKKTKDPTHKEMWFISWNKLKDNLDTYLEHIPSVIFTPLFLNAIEKISKKTNDIDINIKLKNKNLKIYVFEHSENEQKVEYKVSMERNIVDSIKTEFLKWIPDDLSFSNKFNIIKNCQEQV